jgi:hypothetical protein
MIVADMRADGYLEPEKVGRRNRYRINVDQPLRLLGERAVTVGQLLELLGRDDGGQAVATNQLDSVPDAAGKAS